MAATIGALRVVLGADTAAFSKSLKGAESSLSSWGKRAGLAATAVVGAMATAAVGLEVAVRRTMDNIDNLGKTSQKIGVPVEQLSKLRYAADLSGISFESLTTGLAKFNRNIVDAAEGSQTPIRAFETLGITVRNSAGELKTTSELLPELANVFSKMPDGPEKTAMAMKLLGRSGADLIPLLNGGAAGIEKLSAEAEKLGIVIDTKTFRASEQFNDAINDLWKTWDGFLIQLTTAIAPTLATLAQSLRDTAVDAGTLKDAGQGLGDWVKSTIQWFANAASVAQQFGAALTSVGAALDQLTIEHDLSGAWEALKEGRTRVQEIQQSYRDWQTSIDENNPFNVLRGSVDGYVTSLNQTAPAITNYTTANKEAAAAQAAANQVISQGTAVFDQTRTAAEAYGIELTRLRSLYAAGSIDADTYARAQGKAAEDVGATWQQAGGSIAGSFKDIASSYGTENSKMAAAAKAFGAVQATISAFTGAAKALELPFPANLAAMAAVLAQGLAFVASIKSQRVPAFAEGGSFRVGGAGGVDSKTVSFKASPGEMVDIRKPGNDNGSKGGNVEVNVYAPPGSQVRRESKQAGGKQVEDIIIEQVDRGIANGQFDRSLGGRYGLGRRTIQR